MIILRVEEARCVKIYDDDQQQIFLPVQNLIARQMFTDLNFLDCINVLVESILQTGQNDVQGCALND
jgi:hypothetical protein